MKNDRVSEQVAQRIAVLTHSHLFSACSALVARLRRIHEALSAGGAVDKREALVAARISACEALLNLLSVLEAARPDVREEDRDDFDAKLDALRRGLERSLASPFG
jgi:hypothetical protein